MPTGYVVWEGPSRWDTTPIGLILTLRSENTATGDVVQSWILPRDVKPSQAVKGGQDEGVCGTCNLRPRLGGDCYVNCVHGADPVWGKWRRGGYPAGLPPHVPDLRIGAWGDPAMVPLRVWEKLLKRTGKWNGYTHRWKDIGREYRFCMASTETEQEYWQAKELGFRSFRVRDKGDPILPGEIPCLKSLEWELMGNRRILCQECHLCQGNRKKKDVGIIRHGARVKADKGFNYLVKRSLVLVGRT